MDGVGTYGTHNPSNRYSMWLLGMLVGSYVVVLTEFVLTTIVWLFILAGLVVLYIFLKFYKHQTTYPLSGLGLMTLIEVGIFLALNCAILTQLFKGGML